jgi:hypothetical protein
MLNPPVGAEYQLQQYALFQWNKKLHEEIALLIRALHHGAIQNHIVYSISHAFKGQALL